MDQELINDIISTTVGGAAGGAVAGLALYGVQQAHVWLVDKRDTKRVLDWMKENAGEYANWPFLTTRYIASCNNLTEDRVRYLCSHCPEIYMSRGINEDQWTLKLDDE